MVPILQNTWLFRVKLEKAWNIRVWNLVSSFTLNNHVSIQFLNFFKFYSKWSCISSNFWASSSFNRLKLEHTQLNTNFWVWTQTRTRLTSNFQVWTQNSNTTRLKVLSWKLTIIYFKSTIVGVIAVACSKSWSLY